MAKTYFLERDNFIYVALGIKKLRLQYSKFGAWNDTCKGKVAAALKESGDDYFLTVGDSTMKLDICDVAHTRMLLNEFSKRNPNALTNYIRLESK